MNPEQIRAMRDDLKQQGVKYCIGAFVDIHGVPKGNFVPIDHFEDFAAGSELYTGYALDGVGQRPNDDEIASLPDLTRGCVLPWNKEVAWFPADNTFKGQPYEVSTRVALQKQLAEAAKMGFGMNLGIECELYVVNLAEDGTLQIPNPDDDLVKACYDVKRFLDRYTWAPVFNSYGRCESRNADAACNPYLAATLVLAAGLQGIREKLDPGDPHEDNLYELTEEEFAARGISELPRTLDEAVKAFAADPFVEEVLGTELRNEFITYKSEEWRQYHQRVSQWEVDTYARMF